MQIWQSSFGIRTLQLKIGASVEFPDVDNISPNDSISVLFCWWLPADV